MTPQPHDHNDDKAPGETRSQQSKNHGVRRKVERLSQWTWLALICFLSLGYVLTTLYAAQFDNEVRSIAGDRAATVRIKDRLADFGRSYQILAQRIADGSASGRRDQGASVIHEYARRPCDVPRVQPVQGFRGLSLAAFAYPRKSHSLQVSDELMRLCRLQENVRKELDQIQGAGSARRVSFEVVMRDFMSFEKLALLLPLGPHPMVFATATHKQLALALVLSMAVFGSVLFMMRSLLARRLEQAERPVEAPPERPWCWFLFRPLLGAMTGFAVFFLMKTGQLTFGDPVSGAATEAGSLNPYALGFAAFISGFLCWHALERIERTGERLFGSHKRKERWAPGLAGSLKMASKSARQTAKETTERLARQLDVSGPQVQRWIDHQDKVPYPMQARIAAWLNEDPARLFSDLKPESPQGSYSQPARGRSYPRRFLEHLASFSPHRP